MSGFEIKLKNRYLEGFLNGEGVRKVLREYADDIAARVETAVAGQREVGVEVQEGTTDRAVVTVALEGVRGLIVEAESAPLRRAAAAVGLDVSVEE